MSVVKPAENQLAQRNWTVEPFSCFDDMGLCCDVFWCSPCMQGRIYSAVEENRADSMNGAVCCLMFCCGAWPCQAAFACVERANVQEKYNVKKDLACDVCLSIFCSPCVLCQLHTELSAAGNSPGHTCCAPSRVFSRPEPSHTYPMQYAGHTVQMQPPPAYQPHAAQPYPAQPVPPPTAPQMA